MIALVSGGTRGIGLSITKKLQEAGHKVAVIARQLDGADCDLFIQADLSRLHERHALVDKVVDHFGGIDVLINNAGAQEFHKAIDYPYTRWQRSLDLMLTAPFDLSQQAARRMKKGHIINILSTAALQGARNIAAYVAAKHGLLGLTRAMAIEFAPQIHVNAIAPGITETDMIAKIAPERRALLESITPAGRFCEPGEIADAVMFLVNSTAIYGQVITVDNGWMVKNG